MIYFWWCLLCSLSYFKVTFRSASIQSKLMDKTKKKWCKTFIKQKQWWVEHPVLMTQVLQHFLCSFWIILEPGEIGINTCLILQNTLDVTVTALAFQNKREHPNQVKGFVETVVPNYCDPTFASNFRMKIHFRWRIIHFLPPRLCYDLYDLIFIVNIRFIIADHCCCAMIL